MIFLSKLKMATGTPHSQTYKINIPYLCYLILKAIQLFNLFLILFYFCYENAGGICKLLSNRNLLIEVSS